MNKKLSYNELNGNQISLIYDDLDYEVRINDEVVIATGDETEAEMIAESLDVALSILYSRNLLRENKVYEDKNETN